MNKCILIGNLTHDPELAQTASGVSVCKFSVAVNRNYTNQNGERDVDFFNIVTWRTLAENCDKYCVKGMKVAVSGSLQNSSYEDKNGIKRYRTDVIADEVEFIGGKEKAAGEGQSAPVAPPKKKKASDLTPVEDDRLPF